MIKSKDGTTFRQTGKSFCNEPRKALLSIAAICASMISMSAASLSYDTNVECLRVVANSGMSVAEDSIEPGLDFGMDQSVPESAVSFVDSTDSDPCPDAEAVAPVANPELVVAVAEPSSFLDCLQMETIDPDPASTPVPDDSIPNSKLSALNPISDLMIAAIDPTPEPIVAAVDPIPASKSAAVDPTPDSKSDSAVSTQSSKAASANPSLSSNVQATPDPKLATSVALAELGDQPEEPNPLLEPAKKRPDDPMIESVQSRNEKSEQLIVARNSSAVINLKQKVDGVEIADPNIADVVLTSPTRIIITGKAFGTTQLGLRVGDQQRTIAVSVELDLRHLQAMIKAMSPTADVHIRSINGIVILMGSVPDADTAERIVDLASLAQGGPVKNQLDIAGVQQTMLRVVVAEVNKTALRMLGVNWAMGGSDWSRDFFFANNLNQINPTSFGSNGLPNVRTGQLLYGVGAVANGGATNVTFGFPRGEFQMFMNALRENQLARVLAEPNLVAINGQTATFLAGGEVPIPVTQGGATAGSITLEYKEFGVRLGFTPTVLAGQIIRLHVMSEVSDAVPGAAIAGSLPTFTFLTRRVESTIECGNGQTFALAGLLHEKVRAVADKLPALGDLPVLGSLFSSVRYQKDDTELVVLVTPQMVEPLEPHQVAPPPGALMRDPSDFELFGLQQLEGQPQEAVSADGVPRDTFPPNTFPSHEHEEKQVAVRGPWGMAETENN